MHVLCTIIAKNYIAHARTLAQSFLQHHPAGKVYVLLADEPDNALAALAEPFEWVRLADIGIPDLTALQFKYGVTELSTAVKPFLMDYLLRNRGAKELLYLDPDILVTQRLDPLYRRLQDASILLTPHILTPLPDDKQRPEEIDILQAGAYNLGFLGLSHSEETFRMLKWWQERLLTYCLMEPEKGYHVDQGWMDLAPAMYDGVQIVKEPEYNVAYWNLHERAIAYNDGMFEANGRPLAFYHFSGFRDGS